MKSAVNRRSDAKPADASPATPPAISPARADALRILLRFRKDGVLTSSACEKPENRRLADAIRANPTLEDARITELCNDGTLPTVGTHIIAAVRKAAEKGLL